MPLMVSVQDRQNEAATIELLQQKMGWSLKQTTDLTNSVDAIGEGIFVEIKHRKCRHNQYKTLFLSKQKYDKLINVPGDGYFVWVFTDGAFYVRVKDLPADLTIALGGRTDRPGMVNDLEAMIHVPVQYLKEV